MDHRPGRDADAGLPGAPPGSLHANGDAQLRRLAFAASVPCVADRGCGSARVTRATAPAGNGAVACIDHREPPPTLTTADRLTLVDHGSSAAAGLNPWI